MPKAGASKSDSKHPAPDDGAKRMIAADPGRPIARQIAQLPQAAGVYLFRDRRGKVLYVGKAKRLRTRVRNYFRDGGDGRASVPLLRRHIDRVETVVTDSEREALLLEDTLVKEHQPRYNVRLRDDKSHLFLRLRMDHAFPYLEHVRRPRADGNPTFGPYPNAGAARETSRVLHKVFPLRTCSNNKFSHRSRPCLDHQIGKCPAPCVGKISPDGYAVLVEGARKFLAGERKAVIAQLKSAMVRASEELRFEDAAAFRDRIRDLEETQERSTVVQYGRDSADTWALAEADNHGVVVVLRSVGGHLVHTDRFPTPALIDPENTWNQVLLQYYQQNRWIPARIYVPREARIAADVVSILCERRGKRLKLTTPQRGDGRKLLRLAAENAEVAARTQSLPGDDALAAEVARVLKLPRPPLMLECFDVSVHQGDEPVGVRVVFERGQECKALRRQYRLTPGEGRGDVQWMQEMLRRRLDRGIREFDLPDLIVLDGGKTQLNAITKVYQELEIEWSRVPLVALAKARRHYTGDQADDTGERVYLPGRKNPIHLRPASPVFRLIVALRDATHRAAVGYHRKRGRSALLAGIEQVPGLGPARRRKLQVAFPELSTVPAYPPEEVARKAKIPLPVARALQHYLNSLH